MKTNYRIVALAVLLDQHFTILRGISLSTSSFVCQEFHLLFLGPCTFLLLNNKTSLGWRDTNEACTTLQLKWRGGFRRALNSCSLLADLTFGLATGLLGSLWNHRGALSAQPFHALKAFEIGFIASHRRSSIMLAVAHLELFLGGIDKILDVLDGTGNAF